MNKNKQIITAEKISIERYGEGYPPEFTKYGTVINGQAHFHQFREDGKCVSNDGTVHVWRRACSKCDGYMDQITIHDRYGARHIERVTDADGREWRA